MPRVCWVHGHRRQGGMGRVRPLAQHISLGDQALLAVMLCRRARVHLGQSA